MTYQKHAADIKFACSRGFSGKSAVFTDCILTVKAD